MSIGKIVAAALEKDAVSLKESLSEILSERIALALEEKMSELQELSKEKLSKYIDKASDQLDKDWQDTRKGKPGLSQNKVANRFQGLYTAQKRKASGYNPKVTNEEADQLDELSKDTLASYVKKAPADATGTKFRAIAHQKKVYDAPDKATERMHDDMADKLHRRYDNRIKGVSRAVDKLVKESKEVSPLHSGFLGAGLKHEGSKSRMVSPADGYEHTHSYSADKEKFPAIEKHLKKQGFKQERPGSSFYTPKNDQYHKGMLIVNHGGDKVHVKHIHDGHSFNEAFNPLKPLTRSISFNDFEHHVGDEDYAEVKKIKWPYGVEVKFDDKTRTVTFKTAKMATVAAMLDKAIDMGSINAGELLDLPTELYRSYKDKMDPYWRKNNLH